LVPGDFIIFFTEKISRYFGALFGLLIFSPVFICVAIFIYANDGGRVIFKQKRVGRWGREFDLPKFRSMVLNAEALKSQLIAQNHHKEGVTFKMKKDPRITPVGRFIRKRASTSYLSCGVCLWVICLWSDLDPSYRKKF